MSEPVEAGQVRGKGRALHRTLLPSGYAGWVVECTYCLRQYKQTGGQFIRDGDWEGNHCSRCKTNLRGMSPSKETAFVDYLAPPHLPWLEK